MSTSVSVSAAKAEELHQLAVQHAGSAVQYAIECGNELLRVKSALNHGEFGKWCEKLSFSHEMRARYMRAATAAPEISTTVEISSLRGLLTAAAAAMPKPKSFDEARTPPPVPSAAARVQALLSSAHEAPPEFVGPSDEEIQEAEKAHAEDLAALQALLNADDKLAHLEAENKRLMALNRQLDMRMNGLMNEKNMAIRMLKSAQRKLARIEAS